MIDAVFISDLHLSPNEPEITRRFQSFIDWAKTNQVKAIYILGDFFHAWAGDDLMDDWCKKIAKIVKSLKDKGVLFYYIHGNRDFLLGKRFAKEAGWSLLNDPSILDFQQGRIMITHGDQFCTLDKQHQRFRKLTRNALFKGIFLSLPSSWRKKMVNSARRLSQSQTIRDSAVMDVVKSDVIKSMRNYRADILIHGHTHRPCHEILTEGQQKLERYVLSDWDDNPVFLCYDKTNGFYFSPGVLFEV